MSTLPTAAPAAGMLSEEASIARPGYNRWLMALAAVLIGFGCARASIRCWDDGYPDDSPQRLSPPICCAVAQHRPVKAYKGGKGLVYWSVYIACWGM
jgi:hypothetical protein